MTSSDQSGHEQTAASQQGNMQDEAIHWLLRQRNDDMSVEQWDAFTHWLEADPRHSEVYDALLAADDPLGALAEPGLASTTAGVSGTPVAANDNPLKRLVPWAMASAAALILAVFVFTPTNTSEYVTIATAPGERQVVTLSDEISMALNGSSRAVIEEGTTNVEVLSGEVAFAINSDEPSPLRVTVDDLVLTDYGTVFNVVLDETRLSVAVAEGIVAVNPDDEAIQIEAGERAEKARGGSELTLSEIAPDTVATWRVGRLEFDDTLATDAVTQLERSTGASIRLSDRFATARLTGSILIPDDEGDAVRALAVFIGGSVRQDGSDWVIE